MRGCHCWIARLLAVDALVGTAGCSFRDSGDQNAGPPPKTLDSSALECRSNKIETGIYDYPAEGAPSETAPEEQARRYIKGWRYASGGSFEMTTPESTDWYQQFAYRNQRGRLVVLLDYAWDDDLGWHLVGSEECG